ncbi:MAG: hypothetical protein WCX69_03700 [Candidatus Paceibacterota bacterium]
MENQISNKKERHNKFGELTVGFFSALLIWFIVGFFTILQSDPLLTVSADCIAIGIFAFIAFLKKRKNKIWLGALVFLAVAILLPGPCSVYSIRTTSNGKSCESNSVCVSNNCVNHTCCDASQCGNGRACIDNGAFFKDYNSYWSYDSVCRSGILKTQFGGKGCKNRSCDSGICNKKTDICE